MESQKIIQLLVACGLLVLSPVYTSSIVKAYKGPTTTAGINLIKEHEGFHPNFYIDSNKNKAIGYGYVCSENLCDKLRTPITATTATNLLKTQLKSFESCVNQNVQCTQLNSAQFSAIVSLTFNLGCESLKRSALLTKLNRNDFSGAATEFAKYNKIGGKVIAELTKRRAAERALFCSNKAC